MEKGNKTPLKSSTDNLVSEAKKYKSAEEFIKAQTKPHYINIEDIKSSFDADAFSTLRGTPGNQNINLLNEYKSKISKIEKSPIGREITKPISIQFNIDGGDGYRILDGNHRYLQALKNGDKTILAKFDTLKGTSQESKNIFQEKTKSQLTDIWNKANKTPQEIRLATGWERGVDGLWRYEVPDGEINEKHYAELIERKFNEDIKSGLINATSLGEFYDSNELYKAYPELENIQVILYEDENQSASASYNPTEKAIYIYNPLSLKSIEGRDNNIIQKSNR